MKRFLAGSVLFFLLGIMNLWGKEGLQLGKITVSDYCEFLNAKSENQAEACPSILRSGEPGNYHYEPAPTIKPQETMTWLSWNDALSYGAWKQAALPTANFFPQCCDEVDRLDPELKSNQLTFQLVNIEATIHQASGSDVLEGTLGTEEVIEGLALTEIMAMLLPASALPQEEASTTLSESASRHSGEVLLPTRELSQEERQEREWQTNSWKNWAHGLLDQHEEAHHMIRGEGPWLEEKLTSSEADERKMLDSSYSTEERIAAWNRSMEGFVRFNKKFREFLKSQLEKRKAEQSVASDKYKEIEASVIKAKNSYEEAQQAYDRLEGEKGSLEASLKQYQEEMKSAFRRDNDQLLQLREDTIVKLRRVAQESASKSSIRHEAQEELIREEASASEQYQKFLCANDNLTIAETFSTNFEIHFSKLFASYKKQHRKISKNDANARGRLMDHNTEVAVEPDIQVYFPHINWQKSAPLWEDVDQEYQQWLKKHEIFICKQAEHERFDQQIANEKKWLQARTDEVKKILDYIGGIQKGVVGNVQLIGEILTRINDLLKKNYEVDISEYTNRAGAIAREIQKGDQTVTEGKRILEQLKDPIATLVESAFDTVSRVRRNSLEQALGKAKEDFKRSTTAVANASNKAKEQEEKMLQEACALVEKAAFQEQHGSSSMKKIDQYLLELEKWIQANRRNLQRERAIQERNKKAIKQEIKLLNHAVEESLQQCTTWSEEFFKKVNKKVLSPIEITAADKGRVEREKKLEEKKEALNKAIADLNAAEVECANVIKRQGKSGERSQQRLYQAQSIANTHRISQVAFLAENVQKAVARMASATFNVASLKRDDDPQRHAEMHVNRIDDSYHNLMTQCQQGLHQAVHISNNELREKWIGEWIDRLEQVEQQKTSWNAKKETLRELVLNQIRGHLINPSGVRSLAVSDLPREELLEEEHSDTLHREDEAKKREVELLKLKIKAPVLENQRPIERSGQDVRDKAIALAKKNAEKQKRKAQEEASWFGFISPIMNAYQKSADAYEKQAAALSRDDLVEAKKFETIAKVLTGDDSHPGAAWSYKQADQMKSAYNRNNNTAFIKRAQAGWERAVGAAGWYFYNIENMKVVNTYKKAANAYNKAAEAYHKGATYYEEQAKALASGDEQAAWYYKRAADILLGNDSRPGAAYSYKNAATEWEKIILGPPYSHSSYSRFSYFRPYNKESEKAISTAACAYEHGAEACERYAEALLEKNETLMDILNKKKEALLGGGCPLQEGVASLYSRAIPRTLEEEISLEYSYSGRETKAALLRRAKELEKKAEIFSQYIQKLSTGTVIEKQKAEADWNAAAACEAAQQASNHQLKEAYKKQAGAYKHLAELLNQQAAAVQQKDQEEEALYKNKIATFSHAILHYKEAVKALLRSNIALAEEHTTEAIRWEQATNAIE